MKKTNTMKFSTPIDSEINLVFPQVSFAKELFFLIDSNKIYLEKWMSWPKITNSINDTKDFIKNAIIGFSQGVSETYLIQYKTDIIGVIGFDIHSPLKKVEIGYWISEQQQGNGIISKSCTALFQYVFNDLDIDKIQISAATENTASRNVCQRLGFTLEGIIKNSENINGQIVDHAIYGLYNNSKR